MSVVEVVLNGYFRQQAVTGHQRFATEIAGRLPVRMSEIDVAEIGPPVAGSGRIAPWVTMHLHLRRRCRRALLVSMTSRAPVGVEHHLVTVHDLFPLSHPEWFAPSYLRLHGPLLEHHLRTAAGVVTVSPVVADQVQDRVGGRAPVFVVPNAVSDDLDTPHRSEDERSAVDVTGEFFLAVGSLDPRKNFGRLIEAYLRLPAEIRAAAPLVVVGASAASFAATGSVVGATSEIRFLGRVPDRVLASLYRRASVFVSPSLDEGFGIPVVEADRLGHAPLVLSDIPVYRWLVGDAGAIWVDPSSAESITAGLSTAWADRRFGADGSPSMTSRFSWDASADAMAEAIRATLARTSGV